MELLSISLSNRLAILFCSRMTLYDSLRQHGPEYLIGRVIRIQDAIMEVSSILATGASMIIYELNSTTFMPLVLKVPRAAPGSSEYEFVLRGYRSAIQAIDENLDSQERLVDTMEIEIDGVTCFLQERTTPLG